MAKVNDFLAERLKGAAKPFSKMSSLAELSSRGQLSSFSGVFRVAPLSNNEQAKIASILQEYQSDDNDIQTDLHSLVSITSEVKAIHNQAAILHGERIKKAAELLKKYKDGAFTAWLIATYGNRQTPYNFLQYYEFFSSLPQILHEKLDRMPRQAVYTLASRNGPMEKKEEIIQNYNGEPKQEVLLLIRKIFPLEKEDKRAANHSLQVIKALSKLHSLTKSPSFRPSMEEKESIQKLLKAISKQVP